MPDLLAPPTVDGQPIAHGPGAVVFGVRGILSPEQRLNALVANAERAHDLRGAELESEIAAAVAHLKNLGNRTTNDAEWIDLERIISLLNRLRTLTRGIG
jgi:hypothetical protein